MAFSEIIGNIPAKNILINSVKSERVASGYLFQGPDGVGKKLAAINLAKALNCEQNGPEPCGECVSCRKIERGIHPDVELLAPQGRARMIKVEQIKDLMGRVSMMAFESDWKIFIIDDAHCMNLESQNKLLKTLEEPPARTVLILISSEPSRLLPTIISRCQKIVFHAIGSTELEQYLTQVEKLDPAKARMLTALGHGQISRVKKLMDEKNFARREAIISLLAKGGFDDFRDLSEHVSAIEKDLSEFAAEAKEQEQELNEQDLAQSMSAAQREEIRQKMAAGAQGRYRAEIEEVLNLLAIWYRDVLILQTSGNENLVKNVDKVKELARLGKKVTTADLMRFLGEIEKIRTMIFRNLKLTFCLEVLFLRLGFLG